MKHTMMKALSVVMVLAMIMSTFGMLLVSGADCLHADSALVDEVDATCGAYGFKLYACEDCGVTYVADVVEKKAEHTGVVTTPATDATCTAPAMTAGKTCEDCDTVIEAPTPVAGSVATGHNLEYYVVETTCETPWELRAECVTEGCDYDALVMKGNLEDLGLADGECDYEYIITQAPTCKANGTATAICVDCGKTHEGILVRMEDGLEDGLHVWGEEVETDVTCTTDGFKGVICTVCGAKKGVTTPAPVGGHNMVKVTDSEDEYMVENGITVLEKEATCEEDGFYWTKCSNEGCDLYEKVVVEAYEHDWAEATDANLQAGNFVVVDPTCEEEGYVQVKCLTPGCTATKKTDKVAALGHDYEYSFTCTETDPAHGDESCDDCTHAGRTGTYTCKNDATHTGTVENATAEKHALSEDVTTAPGTCVDLAYDVAHCTNANCAYTEKVEDSEHPESLDPNNHALIKDGQTINPTCTEPGWETGVCLACDAGAFKIEIPATGHTVVEVEQVDATCATPGATAYTYCSVCGADEEGKRLTEPEEIPVDANAHPETSIDEDNISIVRPGTCTLPESTIYECATCGKPVEKDGEKNPTNHVKFVDDQYTTESLIKVNVAVAATCTETGKHAYEQCSGCNVITKITDCKGVVWTWSPAEDATAFTCTNTDCASTTVETPALGHDKVTVNAKAETCTEYGYTAGAYCTRCDWNEGVVPVTPHGKLENGEWVANYDVVYEDKGDGLYLAPTCTSTGLKAGSWCSTCENAKKAANSNYVFGWVVAALGHTSVVLDTRNADCTEVGFVVYGCGRCDAVSTWYIDGYTLASEHKFADEEDEDYESKVLTSPFVDCVTDRYTYLECENPNCTEIKVLETIKATGHIYVDANAGNAEKVMKLDCQNITTYLGKVCINDGCTTGGDAITMADVEHNMVIDIKEPTCAEKGHTIVTCLDCELVWAAAENGKPVGDPVSKFEDPKAVYADHIPGSVKEGSYVPATATAPGTITFICAVCKAEYVVELPAFGEDYLELVGSAYNDVVGKHDGAVVNNGQLVVTLQVTSDMLQFRGIELKLGYNANALTFSGYEVMYEFDAAQGVEFKVAPTTNSINIICYMAEGVNVEGVEPNITISGEDVVLVDLYFDVTENLDVAHDDFVWFDDANCTVWAMDDEGDMVTSTIPGAALRENIEVDFAPLGFVNNDAMIDMGDVISLLDLLYSEDAGYVANADIDQNGVVDIVDLALLENYLLSNRTLIDYLLLFLDYDVVAEIELAEVRLDINNDGLMNVEDTDAVLDFLAMAYSRMDDEDRWYDLMYFLSGDYGTASDFVDMVIEEADYYYAD